MRGRPWLLLAWLLLPPSALAQADGRRGPALNWVRLPGAEGCITASELAARVEERLERPVFVLAQHAELAFDGFVTPRAAGGFKARLTVANAQGKVLGARELESEESDCRALDDALVLITALTLFPGDFGLQSGGIALDAETNALLQALFGDEPSELDPAALAAAAPAPASQPQPASVARQAREEQRTEEPKPRARSTRVALEAAPVLAYGVLPGLAFGVQAELRVRLPGVSPLRAGVGHFFERSARAERLESGIARFERSELTLLACPLAPDAALSFEVCAGIVLGIMSASSEGFAEGNVAERDLVFDVGGQGGLRLLLGGTLALRLGLTALLPIVQHTYEYQGLDASNDPLFRSAQASVRLELGLGAEF